MCFSPEADLVAGVVVSGVGIDALRHVKETKQYPLAALPLLLGAHLLVEVYVWWGEAGQVPEYVARAAVWIYLAFALGVLPVLVPVAILAIEPDVRRRRLLMPLALIGTGVAALYMASVITGPLNAAVEGCCLAYDTGQSYHPVLGALYAVVTCFPMLVSSHRRIVVFGMVNLPVAALIGWLLAANLASVWCAWAAVTSVLIAAHIRREALPSSIQPPVGSDSVAT